MKILVCLKHVPDTAAKIRIAESGDRIDETGIKKIVSPYDEYAIEQALRIADGREGAEVVVVSAGAEAAQAALRHGMAMGADRGVLVLDERFDRADALARAGALAALARVEEPSLILCGKYGVGPDEGQTGPMLAELLGLPHAANVHGLEVDDGASFTARRGIEGAVEVLEGSLPALITCDKGGPEPRYASLKGIMTAKKKPLDTKTAAELGVDLDSQPPRVVCSALELPPPRPAGRLLEGNVDAAVRELVRLLREEAKVI